MQTITGIIQTGNGGIRSITIYVWTAVCLVLRNVFPSLKMPVKICVRLHKTEKNISCMARGIPDLNIRKERGRGYAKTGKCPRTALMLSAGIAFLHPSGSCMLTCVV